MKLEDVMLGDLVYANKKPIHVTAATLKLMIEDEKFAESLEPIPLTPEILEKNGFKPIENKVVDEAYIFDRNEFEEPDIIIRRFDFNDSFVLCTVMDNTAIISIAYVHQLQHALRLCGIEKEITL